MGQPARVLWMLDLRRRIEDGRTLLWRGIGQEARREEPRQFRHLEYGLPDVGKRAPSRRGILEEVSGRFVVEERNQERRGFHRLRASLCGEEGGMER